MPIGLVSRSHPNFLFPGRGDPPTFYSLVSTLLQWYAAHCNTHRSSICMAVLIKGGGYAYVTPGDGHQCQSSFIPGATLAYFSPTISQNSYVPGSASAATIATGNNIHSDGIPIWWQSSDLAAFSAALLITSSLSLSASTSTTSTTSSSPNNFNTTYNWYTFAAPFCPWTKRTLNRGKGSNWSVHTSCLHRYSALSFLLLPASATQRAALSGSTKSRTFR